MEIERNAPTPTVKKYIRNGDEYVAFYSPDGLLTRLINATTYVEVLSGSQTFRRLADGNRGNRFTLVEETPEYVVVLAYKKNAGGYAGVRTWTPYPSKTEFDAWFKASGRKDYDVVEEGVTEKKAIELCQRAPLRSMVRATIEESTDPETGIMNLEIAKMRMMTVMIARGGRIMPIY